MPSPSTVGCFSYLARVHTLNVDHHPDLNYGVAINSQDRFLAGDGPLVAGLLSRFGHSTALGANHPADDDPGRAILSTLHEWDVTLLPGPPPCTATRTNIVACDRAGNRTWYGDLREVDDELAMVDVTALVSRDVVYIDAYDVLGDTPLAVLNAATRASRYTVLNLGGSATPGWLTELAGPVDVLQTNGPETNPATVDILVNALVAMEVAELVVVTAGRHGARAADKQGQRWTVPAITVDAEQPQGAGAAFSAALIHTIQSNMDIEQRLKLACATGSLWCTRSTATALPTLSEIAAFQGQPTAAPAAAG
jgi:sugar/nucleoside kinase (ribokinase family)